jgi:hypothetical protein
MTDVLDKLFRDRPSEAVRRCESLICHRSYSDIDEFRQSFLSRHDIRTCQASWSTRWLAARCDDCRIRRNSCICIRCFINGGHKAHRSYLTAATSGNCDCGDRNFWLPSGNCPHHPGPDPHPDQTQLDRDLRA